MRIKKKVLFQVAIYITADNRRCLNEAIQEAKSALVEHSMSGIGPEGYWSYAPIKSSPKVIKPSAKAQPSANTES